MLERVRVAQVPSASGEAAVRARGVAAGVRLLALALAALASLAVALTLSEAVSVQRAQLRGAAFAHPPMRLAGISRLPLSALGAVSSALAAESPAYRIVGAPAGFVARTPAQRLRERFAASGVTVSSGATRIQLGLRAAGYDGRLRPLGSATPRASANRVSYRRSGITEWYANGPLGLEQGFTVARPAAGRGGTVFSLVLRVSGNAHATVSPDLRGATLGSARGPSLRYAGLLATDARGRTLPAHLLAQGAALRLQVDARGARYPLRIDPFFQQGKKLTGGEESGGGLFGVSVALSSDGNTALVGGELDNAGAGAAWVFTRSGESWTQQGKKLTGSEETGAGAFGSSVALSSDGNTALIGGEGDGSGTGAAWVFTRSEGTWAQQGKKLTGSEESGAAALGTSVALSSDGNTALLGGRLDNVGAGAAWVFTRSGSTWTQQGKKLTGGEESGAGRFGRSAALSSDGNTALIGGSSDNGVAGAAWAFTRSGSTWTQQGKKLTGGEESGAGAFGEGVALSSDGNTALIGGPLDGSGIGAAWAFTRSEGSWTQQGAKLTGGEEGGQGQFGSAVALSADGSTALIGGPRDNAGAAWVFSRSGSTWSQEGRKLTGRKNEQPGGALQFGSSVATSAAGTTLLIGDDEEENPVVRSGAAWVFAFTTALTVETNTLPEATPGVPYRAELAAGGGRLPYKWKKIGRFPKGLKLTKTGLISGTPSRKLSPGERTLALKVTDANRTSATASLTLSVN